MEICIDFFFSINRKLPYHLDYLNLSFYITHNYIETIVLTLVFTSLGRRFGGFKEVQRPRQTCGP